MSELRSNFIDECCFRALVEKDVPDHQLFKSDIEQPLNSNANFQSTFNSNEDLNFIDSQYFYATTSSSSESSLSSPSSPWSLEEDDSLNFIDLQNFVIPSSPNATFLTPEGSILNIISRNLHTAPHIYSVRQNVFSHRDSGSTEFLPLIATACLPLCLSAPPIADLSIAAVNKSPNDASLKMRTSP